MSVAFTSRLSYLAIQEELAGLQREVWAAVRDWPAGAGPSIAELAVRLGRKESSICGRVNELRRAGAIEDGPLKMGGCGKQVKTYRALVWQAPARDVADLPLFTL